MYPDVHDSNHLVIKNEEAQGSGTTPLIPALRRLSQADLCELASLVYVLIPEQPELHRKTQSQKRRRGRGRSSCCSSSCRYDISASLRISNLLGKYRVSPQEPKPSFCNIYKKLETPEEAQQ